MNKQTQIVPPKSSVSTTETPVAADAKDEDENADEDPENLLAIDAASAELINLDENCREIQERCPPSMTSRFRRDSTIFRPMSTEDQNPRIFVVDSPLLCYHPAAKS